VEVAVPCTNSSQEEVATLIIMTSVSDEGGENRDDSDKDNDIPIQRKNWESPDYTISKILVKEGDLTAWRPRTGATGEMRLIVTSVTGVDKAQLMSSTTVVKSQLMSGTTVDKAQLMSSTTVDKSQLLSRTNISNYFSQLKEDEEDGGGKRKTSESTKVIEFLIGSAETEVDRTLEKCLQSFLPGEVSHVTMRSLVEPALNTKVTPQLQSSLSREPVWVIIECELDLASLLNAEPVYKWFPQTKLSMARDSHSAGVRLFQEQRYLDAFHKFQRAFQFSVLAIGPADAEQKIREKEGSKEISQDDCLEECRKLKQMCYNNIAACHFQWRHFSWVVELSDLVLNNDPDLVKTLYRRGVSHLELQQYDLAEMDLVRAHQLDPSNRAVNEKLGQVKQRQRAHDTKLAKQMSKMFA